VTTIYGGPELAAAFRTVRGNTVKVVEEIGEEHFDFVAAPGMRTVRALVAHVIWAPRLTEELHRVQRLTALDGFDFAGFGAKGQAFEGERRTKAELLALLKEDGERLATWLEGLDAAFLAEKFTGGAGTVAKTRMEGVMGIKEHEMHHRAQLMLILRMLGGVPHLTRERQARNAARAAAAAAAESAKA
jgi:uncharacterized damage-inducible protein DinB